MTITPKGGTGPGSITPDGSPVDFYTLLSPGDDPEIISSAVTPGGTILELGAGVGRVTHALLERGHRVTAVDESADMLAHVKGAEIVHSGIEGLDLGRRFDAVTLGSQLVNTADDELRQVFLATCARHVAPTGCVLLQWQPAEAHDAWQAGNGREENSIRIEMARVERITPELFSSTMRYTVGERVWTQSFTSRRLTDEELAAELERAGLTLDRFLDERRTWVRALPTG